ncbi:MAG TPA: hypothetical protein VI522_00715 [Gammaproteobacteria bacterium]|nr:hypothetical protein [Gammaproteobacteria bacterium]
MMTALQHNFLRKQSGHVYIHEIEMITHTPTHFKLHAIMLHNKPFCIPEAEPMRTSFVTLDIFRDTLRTAIMALKEAIPRFTIVEAEIYAEDLQLLPSVKEQGIPRTVGELVGIDLAIMKCR